MIRERIPKKDDESIYRLIVAELAPYARQTSPNLRVDRTDIRRRIDRNVTLVVTSGNSKPCGFITFRIDSDVLNVDMLAIDKRHQNRGLGSQLMNEAERYGLVRGCNRVRLFVDDLNAKAIRFYERKGFYRERFNPNYRCYLMSKYLY